MLLRATVRHNCFKFLRLGKGLWLHRITLKVKLARAMCVTQMCREALSQIPCCHYTFYSNSSVGNGVGSVLLWGWLCSPIGTRTQSLCRTAVFK